MYNSKIKAAAEELRSILETVDRCDNEQSDESAEEHARRLVFEGVPAPEAIARASEHQAIQLTLPVESATAEMRLEGVLESLQGHLHKFRESELNGAIKELEKAFARWSKSNRKIFSEDQLEEVFIRTEEWRGHVEAMDRAASIPILHGAQRFPWAWSAQGYRPERPGKKGIMPRLVQGDTGTAWQGLHALTNLILGEGPH